MNRMFYLAVLEAEGLKIPEGTLNIEMYNQEVDFFGGSETNRNGRLRPECLKWEELFNPQVGYDRYTIDFTGSPEFTMEEYETFKQENADGISAFQVERKHAIQQLAEYVSDVQSKIVDGMALAEKFGLPFEVSLGAESFDLRKITAVDWDSSSMYC